MRRTGCGCAATGCAVPLVCILILFGAVGILTGRWAALAAPDVPDAPPAVADIPANYLALYRDAAAHFGLDWPVLAAVGYGTLNRNSTLYSAGASAGIGGSYLVIVEMTTVCIPATADTYQSHIGAVFTTNIGAAVVPLTASPAVVINCALF